jgi:glycerol-3-phosphate dehydrogenase
MCTCCYPLQAKPTYDLDAPDVRAIQRGIEALCEIYWAAGARRQRADHDHGAGNAGGVRVARLRAARRARAGAHGGSAGGDAGERLGWADMLAREQALRSISSEQFDVVVIGGGITGAGVALDAASRGFSVALVEKRDYAAGTSSRSSKLVHGGLRYLQQFDVGLVREALLERQLMVTLAPHLVRPLEMVVPAFDGARPDRLVGVGLNMYDVLALDKLRRPLRRRRRDRGNGDVEGEEWSPDRHRTIGGDDVVELIPALADRDPSSGYLFYDCQTDDARLVLTVLGEAERFGAVFANRIGVIDVVEEGVRARDAESGEELLIRADNVINATGVWADKVRCEELHDEAEVPVIRPSRGTHITLSTDDLPMHAGAIVPAGEGRTIFALPWLGRTLVGTTDNDYEGEIDHVRPAPDDVEYLLQAINTFFARDFGPADLTGAYAGVRPLISHSDSKKSVDISRKAELYETSSGMITITGGKLTTWRRMAKMAVDRLVERDGREAACRTQEIPLGMSIDAVDLPRVEGVPEGAYAQLAGRYGYAAREVLDVAGERGELAQPLVEGRPDLLAEVAFAARREQARTVGDVLLRRTRLGVLAAHDLLEADGTPSAAVERAARTLGRELGWDEGRIAREVSGFAEEAAAEGILAGASIGARP